MPSVDRDPCVTPAFAPARKVDQDLGYNVTVIAKGLDHPWVDGVSPEDRC